MHFGNATFDDNYLIVNVSIVDQIRLSVSVHVLRKISRMQCYSNLNVHSTDGSNDVHKDLFNSTKEVCTFLQDPLYDPFARVLYEVMRSNPSNRMVTRCPILPVGDFTNILYFLFIFILIFINFRVNIMFEIST